MIIEQIFNNDKLIIQEEAGLAEEVALSMQKVQLLWKLYEQTLHALSNFDVPMHNLQLFQQWLLGMIPNIHANLDLLSDHLNREKWQQLQTQL